MKKIPIINQIIKDKRKEMKITQQEFTNLINKAISTVRRYDTGDIIPENILILICDKLNLNFYELLKEQINENKKDQSQDYDKLIKKYEQLLSFHELKKFVNETEEKHIDYLKKTFSFLYPILYDEFYYDLEEINLNDENGKVEITKYVTEIDTHEKKILIKQIKTFENNKKKEKYIDIFPIEKYEVLLKDLKEYFNIKLAIMRKEKLIP